MALTKLQGQLLDTITSLTANNIISSNNITYSGTLTGSADVVNIGSGQIYKDANGNIGIGTSSPTTKLHVSGTGSTPSLFERTGSDGVYLQLKDASGSSVYLGASNGVFAIQTSGSSYSDKLVINSSGNVGIGTSSPGYKLTVNGGNGNAIVYAGTANTAALGCTGAIPYVGSISNSSFLLLTNATVRGVLDTAGNFGLGVTPSGWGSNFKSLQIGSSTGLFNDSSGVGSYLVNNAYYDGSSYKYLNSSYATAYAQFAGQHQWRIASSNTAGSAVTFTSAMTLDASGNLGIGTSSPTARLVSALSSIPGGPAFFGGADNLLLLAASGSAYGEPAVKFQEAGTNVGAVIAGKNTQNGSMAIVFANRDTSSTTSTLTEKMRIDNSGNVGIGKTTPGTKLDVAGRIKGQGYNRYATWSGIVNSPGAFLFNLVSYTGTGQAQGKLFVRGNENSLNGSYAEYLFIVTYADWLPTYYVKLVQVGRAAVNNSYGDIYLYLDNYSSDKYNPTQVNSGATSAATNINVTPGSGASYGAYQVTIDLFNS